MEKAARDLDFMEAARLRDEMFCSRKIKRDEQLMRYAPGAGIDPDHLISHFPEQIINKYT